jgi:hypothetical protein
MVPAVNWRLPPPERPFQERAPQVGLRHRRSTGLKSCQITAPADPSGAPSPRVRPQTSTSCWPSDSALDFGVSRRPLLLLTVAQVVGGLPLRRLKLVGWPCLWVFLSWDRAGGLGRYPAGYRPRSGRTDNDPQRGGQHQRPVRGNVYAVSIRPVVPIPLWGAQSSSGSGLLLREPGLWNSRGAACHAALGRWRQDIYPAAERGPHQFDGPARRRLTGRRGLPNHCRRPQRVGDQVLALG